MASYSPGPASGARIQKEADKWTLILVRDLKHPPARVWTAITEPEHLKEWAPFDADKSLSSGATVRLSTVNAPQPMVSETKIKRADAPKVLEYSWGDQDLRWELEPIGSTGTRLTLWHNINKNFIAMGAAGWHICFDVMDRFLAGEPLGRMVGPQLMQEEGWQRLHVEYAKQFGVELPKW